MEIIRGSFSEKQYIEFIKELLCCRDIWEGGTGETRIELKINADIRRVQSEIYKWLGVPGRAG